MIRHRLSRSFINPGKRASSRSDRAGRRTHKKHVRACVSKQVWGDHIARKMDDLILLIMPWHWPQLYRSLHRYFSTAQLFYIYSILYSFGDSSCISQHCSVINDWDFSVIHKQWLDKSIQRPVFLAFVEYVSPKNDHNSRFWFLVRDFIVKHSSVSRYGFK